VTQDKFDAFLKTIKPLSEGKTVVDIKPSVSINPIRPVSPPPSADHHTDTHAAHHPTLLEDTDRKIARKIQSGKLSIQASLDLHGYTRQQALTALTDFIRNSHTKGHRWVLVITGKGVNFSSVLKKSFPEWMTHPHIAPHIIQCMPAHQNDGGLGAYYLHIRVKKPPQA